MQETEERRAERRTAHRKEPELHASCAQLQTPLREEVSQSPDSGVLVCHPERAHKSVVYRRPPRVFPVTPVVVLLMRVTVILVVATLEEEPPFVVNVHRPKRAVAVRVPHQPWAGVRRLGHPQLRKEMRPGDVTARRGATCVYLIRVPSGGPSAPRRSGRPGSRGRASVASVDVGAEREAV